MFGKLRKHTLSTKLLISNIMGKAVSLYNENNVYVLTFKNSVKLAKFLDCSKHTVGRYVRSGKLFKGNYYIKLK